MTFHDQVPGSGTKPQILIIGGGPAGSAAALTMLKHSHLDVSVLESTSFAEQRVGEVVSASIGPLLDYLGIDSKSFLSEHISAYEHFSSWGTVAEHSRSSTFSLLGSGWHLDRNTFDADMLAQAGRAGAKVYLNAKLRELYLTESDNWQVTWDHRGETINQRADFLIDASGKKAVLARRLGAKHHLTDKLIGLTVFFDQKATRHFMSIESNPYGWWYSAGLPNGRIAVTLMTDADIARHFQFSEFGTWCELLKQSAHTFARLGSLVGGSRIFVRPAHSQILECVVGNKWMAAGDAAVSFDPLSSLGIGHAMSSGIEAARAIIAYLSQDNTLLDNYPRVITETFRQTMSTQRRFYAGECRWPEQPFWSRRRMLT